MVRTFRLYINIFVVLTVMATLGYGQKVTGCYSDLREISEGIIGSGVIKISLKNGRYVGTFEELSNELGVAYDATPLKNISYNKRRRRIDFDITFNVGSGHRTLMTVTDVTGKVSRSGIKMNWYRVKAQYGRRNPFMKRMRKDCS